MYFLKESTKDVGNFRHSPHPLSTFVLKSYLLNIAVEHKGMLVPAFANSAGAGTCFSGGGGIIGFT